MRKKIGIISCYYNNKNCGGQLQAYALCKVLEIMGFDSEQICYEKKNIFPKEGVKEKLIRHVREDGIKETTCQLFSYLATKLIKSGATKVEEVSNSEAFFTFEKSIPHSKQVYNDSNISMSLDDYDVFITGSDQVWNWSLKTVVLNDEARCKDALDVYMLRFVPDSFRKFSYAASISCPYIPDDLKGYYNNSLMHLDMISIREQTSLSLFPLEMRNRISVVLDPTLLLTKAQWCEYLSLGRKVFDKPFIFLYMLNPQKSDRKLIKSISQKLGLPIVTRPNIINGSSRSYDRNLADIEDYAMGPREFVRYIRDAALVITNSFHATVFSLNFHTPFYIIKRKSKVSMHSRIESVAADYNLRDRIISNDCDVRSLDVEGIDWNNVDEVMIEKRKKSMSFLLNALQGNHDGN